MKFDKDKFEYLDATDYRLNSRQKIIKISDKKIGIVKIRKSRIIMEDGEQIVQIADTIKSIDNELEVNLIISGPICSKTLKYLQNQNIEILVVS